MMKMGMSLFHYFIIQEEDEDNLIDPSWYTLPGAGGHPIVWKPVDRIKEPPTPVVVLDDKDSRADPVRLAH
jgi:hypothetical protein